MTRPLVLRLLLRDHTQAAGVWKTDAVNLLINWPYQPKKTSLVIDCIKPDVCFSILMDVNPAWCKFLKALFPFFSNAGFWVLVAFTVDRYIAVCFPLRKAFLCRPRRAIAVCAILLVVSAAKQLQIFWAIGWRYWYDPTTSSYYHWWVLY